MYFSKASAILLASALILLSGVSKRALARIHTEIIMFIINKMADSVYFELADDEIFQQLGDSSKGDFYMWNGTSLGNLFVAASGYNENKVRIQAINLLMCYIKWYKDRYRMRLCLRPPWIFPERTEEFKVLEKTLEFVVKNSIEKRNIDVLGEYQKRFGLMDKFREIL
jgi:hypothetical protein